MKWHDFARIFFSIQPESIALMTQWKFDMERNANINKKKMHENIFDRPI